MPYDPKLISFRRLGFDDLYILYKWLNEEHVQRWWHEEGHDDSLREITRDYGVIITGEEPTNGYVILYDGKAIGYIQWTRTIDWPVYAEVIENYQFAAAVDLFIGEEKFTGKGLGSEIIKDFLKTKVFIEDGINACVVDPAPDNEFAIKAYEKAGFKYIKTAQIEGESHPAYLMELGKSQLGV